MGKVLRGDLLTEDHFIESTRAVSGTVMEESVVEESGGGEGGTGSDARIVIDLTGDD
jgi:hypothetical protein